MKLLTKSTDYDTCIRMAQDLSGSYSDPVIFHCYWKGSLNEKHLISIRSCWLTNVQGYEERKIILWTEQCPEGKYHDEIRRYAEIRPFFLRSEREGTPLSVPFYFNKQPSYYSDVVRYLLLHKYGGCWFDLDILFTRSLDPIFATYGKYNIVYQWESQNYPNGAIFIVLEAARPSFTEVIRQILARGRGWGFQEAKLTYDLPLDLLVLPCAWFDPAWIPNPYNLTFAKFFDASTTNISIDTFFPGIFCFHWHNKWGYPIHPSSPAAQLDAAVVFRIQNPRPA